MEKVTGIGGVFFRAGDPPALQKWYEQHLGITRTPTDYDQRPWWQAAGPTIYQPFPADTSYFDRPTQGWMVNFRVGDLDAMVAQLRSKQRELGAGNMVERGVCRPVAREPPHPDAVGDKKMI